jgi:type IV secretory pathway VirB3-like protein
MCYVLPPSHFGHGKIIYANHLPWYIAVIIVFSKVMWQMFENESQMAKWWGLRQNRAVIECINTTFWG